MLFIYESLKNLPVGCSDFACPAMEDSFRLRVHKSFGSLASESASLSSLWCLSDHEVQRSPWNRDKEPTDPFRSNCFPDGRSEEAKVTYFPAQLLNDLDDLDVDDDGRSNASSSRSHKLDCCSELEIKSSVGLDSTLDFEEEEDEFDKVAVRDEKRGDRLYMKDVNDYETEADDWNELPTSLADLARDPRANHIAANLRLKEDSEAAKKMDALSVSEDKDNHLISLSLCENRDAERLASVCSPEDASLRSIMKRKDSQVDSKSQKRVRFSSECCRDDNSNQEGDGEDDDSLMETSAGDVSNHEYRLPPDYPSGIPDYMKNPSKYTRYTLDSCEMDEGSNRRAYMDFLNMLKSQKLGTDSLQEDAPLDLPKSVVFVPKRKPNDTSMVEAESERKRGMLVPRGIVAIDVTDEEARPMEEDESETCDASSVKRGVQRSSREYRTKPKDHDD